MPEGTIGNFTMLLGVLLSDVPAPLMGNLTVWPGTHQLYEDVFPGARPAVLLQGMPPVEMPAPDPVTGRAGDVVLVHYQVAHGVGPNVSPHTRYMIFFRLSHADHDAAALGVHDGHLARVGGMRERRCTRTDLDRNSARSLTEQGQSEYSRR